MKNTPLILFGFLFSCIMACSISKPLKGKIICIDAGHGATAQTDSFRIGPTGEREEWINLRVALFLEKMLKQTGATILMTRISDVNVPLKDRAEIAVKGKADLFISIHHNSTNDSTVNIPTIYYHGAAGENRASIQFAEIVGLQLQHALFNSHTPVVVASDYIIFSGSGTGVLRNSYGIPGVITEASYFNNYAEEKRLKDTLYNKKEANAIAKAVLQYFKKPKLEILPKFSTVQIPVFKNLDEGKQTDTIAGKWKSFYNQAKVLYCKNDSASLRKAFVLFSLAAQSYPDSYIAGECHFYRSLILKKEGKLAESKAEAVRVKEFYYLPNLSDSLNYYQLLK